MTYCNGHFFVLLKIHLLMHHIFSQSFLIRKCEAYVKFGEKTLLFGDTRVGALWASRLIGQKLLAGQGM